MAKSKEEKHQLELKRLCENIMDIIYSYDQLNYFEVLGVLFYVALHFHKESTENEEEDE